MREEDNKLVKNLARTALPLGRDEVDEHARMYGVKNWWIVKRDRDEWKGLLEEAKAQR